jgi:DGQHR domain-containing protein
MAKAKTKAKTATTFCYEALQFEQRAGEGLVSFHAPVGEVIKWATTDELSVAKKSATKTGPQREQRQAKVTAIKSFMAADDANLIPTAVIVAFAKGTASFTSSSKNSAFGHLEVIGGAKSAAIVDGQHRIYGLHEFDPKTEVALVGLLDADHVEKAFHFLVINNKSSKVPATHTKALLARLGNTQLIDRLRAARMSFESEGIKDIDIVNTDTDSPFYQTIDWTTTPKAKRMVQATAIELSLAYMSGLGLSEFEDRDVMRSVFLTVWRTIQGTWKPLWKKDSRLLSKIGIVCMTRFIVDMIAKWADNDELEIDISDLEDMKIQTAKLIAHMDTKFWTSPWAETSQGGFDTTQGRERVVRALTQLHRNGKNGDDWYKDIDIISSVS